MNTDGIIDFEGIRLLQRFIHNATNRVCESVKSHVPHYESLVEKCRERYSQIRSVEFVARPLTKRHLELRAKDGRFTGVVQVPLSDILGLDKDKFEDLIIHRICYDRRMVAAFHIQVFGHVNNDILFHICLRLEEHGAGTLKQHEIV